MSNFKKLSMFYPKKFFFSIHQSQISHLFQVLNNMNFKSTEPNTPIEKPKKVKKNVIVLYTMWEKIYL